MARRRPHHNQRLFNREARRWALNHGITYSQALRDPEFRRLWEETYDDDVETRFNAWRGLGAVDLNPDTGKYETNPVAVGRR